jgi:putative transposase
MITQAHQDHPEMSIVQLCDLHGISRSWYYDQLKQAEQHGQDIALRDQIEHIILEFSGYGYRRVTHELARQGWSVNHKRVLRIMQEESLLCHLKKKFVVTTTNSRHGFPIYPNVLVAITLTAPDQAWVADFTYIRLRSAFVYLACILDAFSRRCVGWHLSREMTTQLTQGALHQAIVERQPKPGLIHHSDRGVQYASREYVEQLQAIGAQISMSAVGNPYDNELVAYCTPSAWLACFGIFTSALLRSVLVRWRKQGTPTIIGGIHGDQLGSSPVQDRLSAHPIGLCGFVGGQQTTFA